MGSAVESSRVESSRVPSEPLPPPPPVRLLFSSSVPEQRTVASHPRPDLPGVPPANRLPHSCNRLHTGGPQPHQVALHRICTTPDQITTKTPPRENMRLWGRHMSKLAARRITIALIT